MDCKLEVESGVLHRRLVGNVFLGFSSMDETPCQRLHQLAVEVIYWKVCCTAPQASPEAYRVSSDVPGTTENKWLIILNKKTIFYFWIHYLLVFIPWEMVRVSNKIYNLIYTCADVVVPLIP